MGNAAAEGLAQAVPDKGADYDIIVFGLQESTYVVRRASSTEKDERNETVLRPLLSNDESDCDGTSDCDTAAAIANNSNASDATPSKNEAATDTIERVSTASNVSDAGKDVSQAQEACVVELINDINSILKDDFYMVMSFFLSCEITMIVMDRCNIIVAVRCSSFASLASLFGLISALWRNRRKTRDFFMCFRIK